jgi:hypothetical protein
MEVQGVNVLQEPFPSGVIWVEFETLPPASVGFLFGLLFDSEDLCDMIL